MPEETRNNPRRTERIGKYEVLEHIASGGMGAVYKALDTDLQRVVALKVLSPELAGRETMVKRFRQEAQAAAMLRHENIVAIYDVGEFSGTYFLALEFVEGTDLQSYITRKGRLQPDEARQICLQAARALVHAHEQGLVHRDIKPSNFLLTSTKDNRLLVKLTDLGLVRKVVDDREFQLTNKGMTVGTVDYMAPEQARNSRDADIRSDIYSLGCTFYHMLAGTAPFPKGSLTERILQHIEAEPPDVRRLNKAVPEAMIAVLSRMLAKRPEDRYQNPLDLQRDLERLGRGANGKQGETIANPEDLKRPGRYQGGEPTIALAPVGATRTVKPGRPRRDDDTTDESLTPQEIPDSSAEMRKARPTAGDDENVPRRDKKKKKVKKKGLPSWWPYAAAGAGVAVVLLAVGLWALLRPRQPPPPIDDDPPVVVDPAPKKKPDDPEPVEVKIDTTPAKMGPAAWLPKELSPSAPADRASLRPEFAGSFKAFPEATSQARVLQVGRTIALGPSAFRTLAEALAQPPPATGPTVIEIQDQGPIFVPPLPPLGERRVIVRAAPGYRPLLAWELPPNPDGKEALFTIQGGLLALENLDIVARWPEPRSEPPALIHLHGAEFFARGCTFSISGRHPRGIGLVRIEGGNPKADARCWLQRCFARGPELLAVDVRTAAEVLIDTSLLVGYRSPLVQATLSPDQPLNLRLIRATLVGGVNLIDAQPPDGKGGATPLHAYVLDSVLVRNDSASAEGDMLRLEAGATTERMSWQAVNSVYAGWKKLLMTNTQTILGHDLSSWRKLLEPKDDKRTASDRAVGETWPSSASALFDDAPSVAFAVYSGPLAYAARSASGTIGCPVGALPDEPHDWLRATLERRPLALGGGSEIDEPPPVEPSDGLYHGEKLEIAKVADLGQHLQKLLQNPRLAPRVVFQISGTGPHMMTPLKVTTATQLVLIFEHTAKEPLTLTVNPDRAQGRTALFETENGGLELHNAHVRFGNDRIFVMPANVVKVQGGDLTLVRCNLQGPLSKASDAYKALIVFVGSQDKTPATLTVRDCVLQSGKPIFVLREAGIQFRMQNTVAYGLGVGIQIDLSSAESSLPAVVMTLEQNTWAVRQAFLSLKTGNDWPRHAQALAVQAQGNYWATPFEDTKQTALVRYREPAIAAGQLVWQGKRNAFDARLTGFFEPFIREPLEKQSFKDWAPIWGPVGEFESASVEASRAFADVDAPQLDQLTRPRLPRGDGPAPGAGIARLLSRKKS